ncbi:hypothetical protein BerOc1_00513 [Pseudodesulfovibrio hydrargyri]|uniref:Lipoprotein n=1 Tax=Pseudodesulfovibrio hydrargyri TaxID=2125990 RepID=A0A1J5NK59_9BACT|nr:hypothetical protein [Pseudodesulfovibrio hydrargyri]OIQ52041.1 hypothetical protein BerOc1_00513 [Pseudodesulfovibrio hydrargyri]
MKIRTALLVVALCGSLCACNTLGSFGLGGGGNSSAAKSDSATVKETSAVRFPQAVAGDQIIPFSNSPLLQPKTLWIPARYRRDKSNALFIDGRRVVVDGGYSNVVGFLFAEDGYLVAVKQPAKSIGQNSQSAVIVFYFVKGDGSTRQIGRIDNAYSAVVAKNGIFARRPAGGGTYEYLGYDVQGNLVSGPQGVLHAAPLPDGGWYYELLGDKGLTETKVTCAIQGADGSMRIVGKKYVNVKGTYGWASGAYAAFNMPNYSESTRTGLIVSYYEKYLSYWTGTMDWYIQLIDSRTGQPVMTKDVGSYSKSQERVVQEICNRTALFSIDDKPFVIAQTGGELFSAQCVSKIDVASKQATPIFEIMGGGMNMFRMFTKGNSGKVALHDANDAYAFRSGDACVLFRDVDGKLVGYDLVSNKATTGDEIELFLSHYGVTR